MTSRGRAKATGAVGQADTGGGVPHGAVRWLTAPGTSSSGTVAGKFCLARGGMTKPIVEQDHRGVKRVTRPMLGFKSFEAAQDTLLGIELMHMIKKKQLMVESGDEGLTAAERFYSLAA